jgi:hypothetical protein
MLYAGDEFYDDDVTSGPIEADVPAEGPVPTAVQNAWNASHDDDDELDCTWCAGDGAMDQCDDPLGCPGPHDKWGGGCPCRACAGSGLRSKQMVF